MYSVNVHLLSLISLYSLYSKDVKWVCSFYYFYHFILFNKYILRYESPGDFLDVFIYISSDGVHLFFPSRSTDLSS